MTEKSLKSSSNIRKWSFSPVPSAANDGSGRPKGVNKARLYIRLKPYPRAQDHDHRADGQVRKELEPFKETLQPQVAEASDFGDQAPFNLNLVGDDYATLVPFANEVAEKIRGIKDLADVQSTYDGGKPNSRRCWTRNA